MKVKIFHSRKIDALEEAVNKFLDEHEVTVQLTQFSANVVEDEVQYWPVFTLVLFYWPRVDEQRDPFQEEAE